MHGSSETDEEQEFKGERAVRGGSFIALSQP